MFKSLRYSIRRWFLNQLMWTTCMCQDLGGTSFVNKADQSESAQLIPTRVIVENRIGKLSLMTMVKK